MNLRYIIIFSLILILVASYIIDYKKEKITEDYIINNDNDDIYINPYFNPKEGNYNIIKKYNDDKINIINNIPVLNNKNSYDTAVLSSLNNNSNKNNLMHFINFLI